MCDRRPSIKLLWVAVLPPRATAPRSNCHPRPQIKPQSALSRVPPPPDPHRPRGADGLSSMPVSTHARSNNSATATAVAAAAGNHFDYFNLPQLPCSTAIIPAGIIRFEILLDTMGHKLKVIREFARSLFKIIQSWLDVA